MELDAKEKRMVLLCLNSALEKNKEKLSSLDEDTDEHMELGNDTMLIQSIITKLKEN